MLSSKATHTSRYSKGVLRTFHAGDLNPAQPHERWQSCHYTIQSASHNHSTRAHLKKTRDLIPHNGPDLTHDMTLWLWSSQDCRLAVPTPRSRQSRLFSRVVPRWWNDLPSATRTGASLSMLKTQLFREHLLPSTSLYACTLSLHHHPVTSDTAWLLVSACVAHC